MIVFRFHYLNGHVSFFIFFLFYFCFCFILNRFVPAGFKEWVEVGPLFKHFFLADKDAFTLYFILFPNLQLLFLHFQPIWTWVGWRKGGGVTLFQPLHMSSSLVR